ncbi:hypothetical protein EK21DRAFT_108205 [Setomelanomma holmii]|uniref:Uncharacterized protein n=1 Tax=Setomelanomma holmii TaxID=210430 RepID=A0A9P4HJJ6_9PLEO|nr:hypothetical protein EK21DRAFT_108205 [Setomelanomma holmii]
MPVIKREESPEAPIASIAPAIPTGAHTSPRDFSGLPMTAEDAQDVKPTIPTMPPPKPYIVAAHTRPTLSLYNGSSPRKYRFSAPPSSPSNVVVSRPLPFAPRLPSRLDSAVATVGRVNKATSTRTTNSTTPHTLPRITHLTKALQRKDNRTNTCKARMDNFFDHNGEVLSDIGDLDEPSGFPPMFTIGEDDRTVTIPKADLDNLRYQVQLLEDARAANEEKVRAQDRVIQECLAFNQSMHVTCHNLNARLTAVEAASTFKKPQELHEEAASGPTVRFRAWRGPADARSRSPSPSARAYRERDDRKSEVTGSAKKGRKKLQISVPDKVYAQPAVGLPTPQTSFTEPLKTAQTPKTPLTPGRIGPPSSAKKTYTCVSKRGYHNLNEVIPPPYVQIPLLPLTDTEIIVFFFNSLTRPIVSLRLYAREWGPASICDVLNAHRVIEPPYLRNTVSVKCTTAIKNGRKRYGDDWDEINRAAFKDMRDDRATDMISLAADEIEYKSDFDIRALCNGLKMFPDETSDGGIFTRCVKWCHENNAAYTLANVWELASDLDAGNTPKHISSPHPSVDEPATPKQEDVESDDGEEKSVASDDSGLGAIRAIEEAF